MAKDIKKDVILAKRANTRVFINVMLSSTELTFRRTYRIGGFIAMLTAGNDQWVQNLTKAG